jgi:imidazolonepropionase-like amidohydrolase
VSANAYYGAGSGPVILDGCTVIPCAEPDQLITDAAIAVENGRIKAVGPRRDVLAAVAATGGRRIDLEGSFVIPGLWDSHVHLGAYVPPYEQAFAHETPGHHMIRCVRKMQDNLRCGITSLRSLGEENDADLLLRDAVDAGEVEGPRIFATGDIMWTRRAAGADEFRRHVRAAIARGADQVKLLSSGGIPWRSDTIGHTLHTFEEIAAAAEEAHRWAKPLVVHAMGDETILAATQAGADTIEHGFVATERGIAAIAESGAMYCPNLTVTAAWDPVQLAAKGYPDWFTANAAEAAARHHEMFREAVRLGIPILAGVDDLPEGDGPVGIEMHEDRIGLIAELRLMQANGMTAAEALLTATRNAAAAVRAQERLGTLEPGKLADLVVLSRNPLDDLDHLASVTAVWKGGRPIRLTPGLEPGWRGGGIR